MPFPPPPTQNYVEIMYKLPETLFYCTQSYLHICTGSVSLAQGSDILST